MASLIIQEYRDVPQTMNGAVPVPVEPPVAVQTVSFTTSTQSSALNAATRYVIMRADAAFYYDVDQNPTATTSTSVQISADTEKHIGVRRGKGDKIAAYDGTS